MHPTTNIFLVLGLVGVAYGDAAEWNGTFPSQVECYMWRTSAVVVPVGTIGLALDIWIRENKLGREKMDWGERRPTVVGPLEFPHGSCLSGFVNVGVKLPHRSHQHSSLGYGGWKDFAMSELAIILHRSAK